MSRMSVFARSLACWKHPLYNCLDMWSCQYCRRMAIHTHVAGLWIRMSSRWVPKGINGSSPLKGIVVCINSGVQSHLGTQGTGKDSCSFQCWVPHSIVANTSVAYFKAFSCWDDHTPGLHTSWPPRPLLLLHLQLLERFLLLLCLWLLLRLRLLLCALLCALLLLHTLSSSSGLSGLSLVLEHPQSQFSCPSCWV